MKIQFISTFLPILNNAAVNSVCVCVHKLFQIIALISWAPKIGKKYPWFV